MRTFFVKKIVEYCLFVLMVSEDKKKGKEKKNKKNLPRTKWILLRCDPQKEAIGKEEGRRKRNKAK